MHTDKIPAMRSGGAALAQVRDELVTFTKVGQTFAQVEKKAQELIAQHKMKPSFSTVKNYHWATCIMKNEEMCHGIPSADKIVHDGDVITIDVGLINQGYHLDTTTTFVVGTKTPKIEEFLAVGKKSLKKAIDAVSAKNTVYDMSYGMQKVVEKAGYSCVTQLTGHGVGEELHMAPSIPCVAYRPDKRQQLKVGQTLAVEIMYAEGEAFLVLDEDGWTYKTADNSLAGMFEETVLVTEKGCEVLTKSL